MSVKIKGAEYPLSKIFSSDFEYAIPVYQRPYSWTETEAGELFDDLYDFFTNDDKEENYFLGSIVLIKEEDKPYSEVIDGQQRLTTLTILLAALTSYLSGDVRKDFNTYIIEPGKISQGLKARPRLTLRSHDKIFFENNVQSLNFENLKKISPSELKTEAQVNIVNNTLLFLEKIKEQFGDDTQKIIEFGSCIVQRCYLVVVSTPTQTSAFRVFSVMNNRGMNLHPTDVIKAEIIGAISESNRKPYTDVWENLEIQITRDGFQDLFSHLRMLKIRTKPRKSLLEDFHESDILKKGETSAIEFISDVLIPYANAYDVLKRCKYQSSSSTKKIDDKINELLSWLNRIDNTDWLPVALIYYNYNKNNPTAMFTFLQKLERLAAFIRVTSMEINRRLYRYARIINEIDNSPNTSHISFGTEIELTDMEKRLFRERLESDVYQMTSKKRNYLILRLDSFLADKGATYDSNILTVEHVLPQTVKKGSEWERLWSDEEVRLFWLHKIANLVPLSQQKNSEAQNFDFNKKKDRYFKSKSSGVVPYALTTQVLNYEEWTPEVVEKRQKELIGVFVKKWDLDIKTKQKERN